MTSGKKLCAYCGQNEAIEVEHVIGKCFFPKPHTGIQFITVPTCPGCNRGAWLGGNLGIDKDEEYTRCLMTAEWHTGRHPAAQKLWKNEIPRSIKKNPNMYPLVVRNPEFHRSITSSGVLLPPVLSLSVDWKRFRRVLEKIARGLYYHETGTRLPATHQVIVEVLSMVGVGVGRSPKFSDPSVQLLIQETQNDWKRSFGNGVFRYCFRKAEEPESALWLMSFYDGAYFLVAARPLKENEEAKYGLPAKGHL